MNKKLEAKKAMLQQLSGKTRDKMYENVGKELKGKKVEKVTVMAPDKEGIKKGLSLAEKLMEAKFGKKEGSEEESCCPECGGEGCESCDYESEESEESEEEAE